MEDEIEKAKHFVVVEIVEYLPKSIVSKTIIKKTTGAISAVSVDAGEGMAERISPFDTFIQIIDGKSEVIINGVSTTLKMGQGMVIPAHARCSMVANERFKMISTLIKSGYESIDV
jgi:quercetin dioxygenase-like cupin family protein